MKGTGVRGYLAIECEEPDGRRPAIIYEFPQGLEFLQDVFTEPDPLPVWDMSPRPAQRQRSQISIEAFEARWFIVPDLDEYMSDRAAAEAKRDLEEADERSRMAEFERFLRSPALDAMFDN